MVSKEKLLIELAPATVPVLRGVAKSHYQKKSIKQQKEYELKIAEARANEFREDGDSPVAMTELDEDGDIEQDPIFRAADLAEELDDALERSHQVEDCSFCREVIASLEDQPASVQRQGLAEMRELKRVMEGSPSREQIDAVMDDMSVVPRLIVE